MNQSRVSSLNEDIQHTSSKSLQKSVVEIRREPISENTILDCSE